MASPAVLSLRSAIQEDRSKLANLLHFETYVHRHLDWRRPLDWLGHHPYLILETTGKVNAALACPPDPDQIAWIRLFAASARTDPAEAWAQLWPVAEQELKDLGVHVAAAIPLHDWFRQLLLSTYFEHIDNVVLLDWKREEEPLAESSEHVIRDMQEQDLPGVFQVDQAAFAPLWQNSLQAVELAFRQSGSATVIEDNGRVVAYQISTVGSHGLHLARLATHPKYQAQGMALALVKDLQSRVIADGDKQLTVNTQEGNLPSLALYEKLGFKRTNEEFPVFELQLHREENSHG